MNFFERIMTSHKQIVSMQKETIAVQEQTIDTQNKTINILLETIGKNNMIIDRLEKAIVAAQDDAANGVLEQRQFMLDMIRLIIPNFTETSCMVWNRIPVTRMIEDFKAKHGL